MTDLPVVQGLFSFSNLSGQCCAISGLGRYLPGNSDLVWSDPGLKMCHIIPPGHFCAPCYKVTHMDKEDNELTQKRRMILNPQENAIVLLRHFHALWKARLVAIGPSTRLFGASVPTTASPPTRARRRTSTACPIRTLCVGTTTCACTRISRPSSPLGHQR